MKSLFNLYPHDFPIGFSDHSVVYQFLYTIASLFAGAEFTDLPTHTKKHLFFLVLSWAIMDICRPAKNLRYPICKFPAEVKEGSALPFYFNSYRKRESFLGFLERFILNLGGVRDNGNFAV